MPMAGPGVGAMSKTHSPSWEGGSKQTSAPPGASQTSCSCGEMAGPQSVLSEEVRTHPRAPCPIVTTFSPWCAFGNREASHWADSQGLCARHPLPTHSPSLEQGGWSLLPLP